AAGLMCAIEAGRRGRSVVVLERNETPGKKIRISGGGRCNFTNIHTTPEGFISANPHFHKSALALFARRFHSDGAATPDRIPRKEAWTTVLRRHLSANH